MVKISLNSATRKCVADSSFLGFEGENQANTLVFSFTDQFIDGTAVLNIKRGKDIGFVAVDKMQRTYELPVRSSLLSQIGDVEFQFVLNKADGTIIKFDSFIMTVEDAIDTDAPLPEEYPSWVEMANTKLSEVDVALENTIKATSNANQVATDLLLAKQNGEFDGEDGKDGTNGVSPTFETSQVEGGAKLTIRDVVGTHTVFLANGPKGEAGSQGERGERGERGLTGNTGASGKDGFSPVVNTYQTTTGAEITITDKSGTQTVTLSNGRDGKDGKDGAGVDNYPDLTNKPKINGVELDGNKNLSELGIQPKGNYLTSYTESDPTVPSWAKQSSKPSYTKSEVGLGNVDNVKQYSASNPPPYPVTSVNGKTGAVTIEIPTVPTKTSQLTNDSGFATETYINSLVGDIETLLSGV